MDPNTKIVMLTGEGNIQLAVAAMKAGACDYITKPTSLAELRLVLERTLGQSPSEKAAAVPQRRQSRGSLDANIGESPAMLLVKSKVRQVLEAEKRMNDNDLPTILIAGETGTGKELLARALNFEGVRSNWPLVEVNCASLPPTCWNQNCLGTSAARTPMPRITALVWWKRQRARWEDLCDRSFKRFR